jgi:hypothetical protein
MSLFTRKSELEPVPKGGGLNVLRGRARAHARTPQGMSWLRDALQASTGDIDAFLNGGPARFEISLLIRHLSINATYDETADLLRSTAPEAASVGIAPASWSGGSNVAGLNDREPGVIYQAPGYPRLPDAETKPARLTHSGWA